jgi:hypothetical protein
MPMSMVVNLQFPRARETARGLLKHPGGADRQVG